MLSVDTGELSIKFCQKVAAAERKALFEYARSTSDADSKSAKKPVHILRSHYEDASMFRDFTQCDDITRPELKHISSLSSECFTLWTI